MKQLYTGEDPWSGTSRFTIPIKVVNGERPPRPRFRDTGLIMPDGLWQIVEECWVSDASKRPLANDLVRRFKGVAGVA